MAITTESVIDLIQVTTGGHIQVRRSTYFVENGQRISEPTYHRGTYSPGDRIPADADHAEIKAIAAIAWTPARLEAEAERRGMTREQLEAASTEPPR